MVNAYLVTNIILAILKSVRYVYNAHIMSEYKDAKRFTLKNLLLINMNNALLALKVSL